jgi:hypothetical protein
MCIIRTTLLLIAEPDSGEEIDMKPNIILIFVLLPFVAFADTYRETRNLELPSGGAHTLQVRAAAGSLTLRGVQGTDMITVIAAIESQDADKENVQLLVDKMIQLDLRQRYDQILLLSTAATPPLTDIEVRINLDIRIPASMNVSIIDGSGPIDIKNITGNLSIDDDSGAIEVENIKGRIQIEDGSGDIEIHDIQGRLEIIDGSGEIVIEHVTGDVTINDASGDIEVNHIDGNVTISDGSGSIDIYRVSKNVFIREAGTGEVDIDGVQGKVTIRE